MKNSASSLNVPVKLGLEGEWFVSEINLLTPEKFQCLLERSIPLHANVQVVMILPIESEGKKSSHKIDCEGTVKSIDCIQDEKKELKYLVGVFFKGLSASEKRLISDFSKEV